MSVANALSTAVRVRDRVHKARAGSFIRSSELPGSRSAVLTTLSRLHADGDLVRVRNGIYWKSVSSRFGGGRPGLLDAGVVAAGVTGVGPAGWSATQVLGLSTQLPAIPELAVAGPTPTLKGVRFHQRNNLARRGLSFLEIALLESLRDFPRYAEVDFDVVTRRVEELVANGRIRLARVRKAAASEHSPALRRNLQAVLEGLGRGDAVPD